jgi:PilZ domain
MVRYHDTRWDPVRDEIRNIRDVWQAGYQRLLDEARGGGRVQVLPSNDERRRCPRFPVRSEDIASPQEAPLAVEDMSITGVAFRSRERYAPQRPLTLSLANVFSTVTDVVACEPLGDPLDGAPRYRVRCRFHDEEHGLQFLTLTLELEHIERA